MAAVVEGGPLVVDVMCVSVLVGAGLDLDVVNVAGLVEDVTGETEVTEAVRVSVGMSVTGMSVVFMEPIVFTGVVFGVPIPVVASVAADATGVVGVVNISVDVGAGVVAVDVLKVLSMSGSEVVVVIKVLSVVGEKFLSVTVVIKVFLVVREGVVAELGTLVGVGDAVVWTLAAAGVVLLVVPVIEEIRVSGVVCVAGTKEEGGAVVVGVFPGVVTVGGLVTAEVTLLVVDTG